MGILAASMALRGYSQADLDSARRRGIAEGELNGKAKMAARVWSALSDSLHKAYRGMLEPLVERADLDAQSLKAGNRSVGKNARAKAEISRVASEARKTLVRAERHLTSYDWPRAGADIIELGRNIGRIERMIRVRRVSYMKEIFLARERWRMDPATKHTKFDSLCVRAYGLLPLSALSKKRLQNLIADFKRSHWRERNLLLAWRKSGNFYDPNRGR